MTTICIVFTAIHTPNRSQQLMQPKQYSIFFLLQGLLVFFKKVCTHTGTIHKYTSFLSTLGLGDQTDHIKVWAACASQDRVNWAANASKAPGSGGLDELLFRTLQQSTPSPQYLPDRQACGKQEVVTHFVNRSLGTGSTSSPVPRANTGSRCPVSKRQAEQEINMLFYGFS